jgi:hypothetical protein|tara:strand:+ start:75 stop:329 length:255 start_codon:yes stop_codon:yes gene_type:complete
MVFKDVILANIVYNTHQQPQILHEQSKFLYFLAYLMLIFFFVDHCVRNAKIARIGLIYKISKNIVDQKSNKGHSCQLWLFIFWK